MVAFKTFAESCKTIWFKMITCCDDQEEEPERKLVIGEPYNFRREDISIAGLSASEQSALQARAVADADRMLRTLQPLTSPSNSPYTTADLAGGGFGAPARPAPVPSSPSPTTTRLARARQHARSLSDGFKNAALGYSSLSQADDGPDATEMRKLRAASLGRDRAVKGDGESGRTACGSESAEEKEV